MQKKIKKTLIIVNNETSAILMSAYSKNKNYVFDIVYENNFSNNLNISKKIKYIFRKLRINKFLCILDYGKNGFFYLKQIQKILYIFRTSQYIKKKILFFLKKNNLNDYDEIWISNSTSAKYVAKIFYKKKIKYFFHGYGDIGYLRKYNFLKTFKLNIEKKLNYFFFSNINFFGNKKIEFYNFFSKYYDYKKFTYPKTIQVKLWKSIFFDYCSYFPIKKKYKNLALINGNLPNIKISIDQEKFINTYVKKIIEHIPSSKYSLLIKYKKKINYPFSLKKKFENKIKKLNFKLVNYKEISDIDMPFEILALKLKPKIIFSTLSTSEFILEKLFKYKVNYFSTIRFIQRLILKNNLFKKELEKNKLMSNGIFISTNTSIPNKIKVL